MGTTCHGLKLIPGIKVSLVGYPGLGLCYTDKARVDPIATCRFRFSTSVPRFEEVKFGLSAVRRNFPGKTHRGGMWGTRGTSCGEEEEHAGWVYDFKYIANLVCKLAKLSSSVED